MLPRALFIAGNWKMNPTSRDAAVALAQAVKAGVGVESSVHVAVCPPSVYLEAVDAALEGSPVGLGAQNMHPEASGAYTGEISAPMLLDAGCTHVILGHSERRHGMGETDSQVNAKLHAALAAGLIPIVCIGELLSEREASQTEAVLNSQLVGSLARLSSDQIAKVVIAYEPVWAIGTGKVASPEQAQDAHAFIRGWLSATFGAAIAERVVVQYGGSVKADNAQGLLCQPDIDGALVGGASLKHEDFLGIIAAAQAVMHAGKSSK